MFNAEKAKSLLTQGEIIIYPTDTVYGIGCLPSKQTALETLLAFKNRPNQLIVIIDDWHRFQHWVTIDLDLNKLEKNKPTTWILPASEHVPKKLQNTNNEIAIRKVTHAPTCQLLKALDEPLVSTSANYPGEKPSTEASDLDLPFIIIPGPCGKQPPSTIIHYTSGTIIRP